jgi:uncharacterized protein YkwD
LVFIVAVTARCGGASKEPVRFGEGLPVAIATPTTSALERAMFDRVNRDRAKNQLPALKYDFKLADIARSHAADMRENHFFSHESPRFGLLEPRLRRAAYLFRTARENLAEAPTVDDAESGLLKSPHHYENLMSTDVTHVGIGIVQGGVQDPRNLTVTQIFSTPGKLETDAEALTRITNAISSLRQRSNVAKLVRNPVLDQIAKEELASLAAEPNASSLKAIGTIVTKQLARSPIKSVSGVSVSAQVLVDSSQFSIDGALLSAKATCYGLAVDHRSDTSVPRLRVLLIIGMR